VSVSTGIEPIATELSFDGSMFVALTLQKVNDKLTAAIASIACPDCQKSMTEVADDIMSAWSRLPVRFTLI
jgi:hypothetical protein